MCRMLAFAKSGNISKENNDFRIKCLKGDRNCLKNQSLRCINAFGKNVLTVKDILGIICKPGNPDGWGIAAYSDEIIKPIKVKGLKPAFEDYTFDKAANDIIAHNPSIIMAHIRLASKQCSEITEVNIHPFSYENWNFMHNGFISGALSPEIKTIVNDHYSTLLNKSPQGTTDSETAFFYFLGKMIERFGTTDSNELNRDELKAVFALAVKDLVARSSGNYFSLETSPVEVSGEINVPPSCNFIVSDGRFLMAFCKGPKLYLGIKNFPSGEKEYIVSSEIICMHDQSLKWLDLPENHILFLDRQKGFYPEFLHLEKAVELVKKIC